MSPDDRHEYDCLPRKRRLSGGRDMNEETPETRILGGGEDDALPPVTRGVGYGSPVRELRTYSGLRVGSAPPEARS